jgi:hypothetical protein
MPGIGVVSTITFVSTDWEYAFTAGLDDETWYLQGAVQQNVGFTSAALQTAVGTVNSNGSVTHVVTVGGLAAAIAACAYGNANAGAKPFLSLVGGTSADFPGTAPPASFQGGVSLESFSHNGDRLDHLTGRDGRGAHQLQDQDIALLINPDSAVGTAEQLRWPSDGGVIYTARSQTEIQTAFNTFASSHHKAVIISADPFFTQNMEYLIQQANPKNKHVCYPFQEYKNTGAGKTHPKHNNHTLHGPSLSDAYTRLGAIVSDIINNGNTASPRLEPSPPIVVNDP